MTPAQAQLHKVANALRASISAGHVKDTQGRKERAKNFERLHDDWRARNGFKPLKRYPDGRVTMPVYVEVVPKQTNP